MRKILLAIGILLIVVGVGITSWFFIQNSISEKKMAEYTTEFMESINDPVPEIILEGDTIGVIVFPTLDNEKVAIKEGTTNYILSIAAGHMTETEEVWDESGNSAIAAHNNTFFKNLSKLQVGDKILVYTRQGVFEYTVYNMETIKPTDFSILDDVANKKILTLITCDFTGANREIVQAEGGQKISEAEEI